jgi:alanyl-tRNA synthetase
VRVVRIADYSMELCGGTHTKRTGDIGLFKIVSEGGIAAGVRRIEALTGRYAFNYLNNRNDEILIISKSLGVNPGDILKRIDRLKEENKILSRDIESLERRLMNINAEELISSVRDINGIKVISSKVNIDDSKKLRNFADILIDRIKRGIVLLGSVKDNRVSLVISVSKDLIERYHAGNIMKEISAVVGGKGGGKANMGEGGGKDPQKLEKALNKLFEILSSG